MYEIKSTEREVMTVLIKVNNFRSLDDGEFVLKEGEITKLRGANRAGKSSVREALCFAFTGRDSSGGTVPTHLIRKGEQKASVRVSTPEFQIERTLSVKKDSVIKIYRAGAEIGTQLTQTKLLELLGVNEDIILSAMIPGYFMRLSSDKRLKIFSSMTPAIDRTKFIADMCGLNPAWILETLGDLTKKVPPVSTVSSKRLEIERGKAALKERISSYTGLKTLNSEMPVLSSEEKDLISAVETYKEGMKSYAERLKTYSREKLLRDNICAENNKKEITRNELLDRLLEINQEPVPDEVDWSSFHNLRNKVIPLPTEPKMINPTALSGNYCTACGQAVSISYKDKVIEEQEKTRKSYETELEEVKLFNREILKEAEIVHRQLTEKEKIRSGIISHNANCVKLSADIERQLLMCTPISVPEEPSAPSSPSGSLSKDDIWRAEDILTRHQANLGYFQKVQERLQESRVDMENAAKEIERADSNIKALELVERALKDLPQKEASLKQSLMVLEDLPWAVISVEDGFCVSDSIGVPYECMSSGQALRVDVALSCKFYEFLLALNLNAGLRFYPIMFVDNTDLADWSAEIVFPEFLKCVVFAYVEPGSPLKVEV